MSPSASLQAAFRAAQRLYPERWGVMRSGVLGNFGWGLKVCSIIYVFASGTQHALFHSPIVFIIYAKWRWSQDHCQPGSCCQAENLTNHCCRVQGATGYLLANGRKKGELRFVTKCKSNRYRTTWISKPGDELAKSVTSNVRKGNRLCRLTVSAAHAYVWRAYLYSACSQLCLVGNS